MDGESGISADDKLPLGSLALVGLSAFGLAACITFMWLAMRTLMGVADPSATAVRFTSAEVPWLWIVPASILAAVAFAAVHLLSSIRVGGFGPILPLWTALFLSLGWNFLVAGFPPSGVWNWAWIVNGALFVLMGAAPLPAMLRTGEASALYIQPRVRRGEVDERATLMFRMAYSLLNVGAAAGGVASAVWLFARLAG